MNRELLNRSTTFATQSSSTGIVAAESNEKIISNFHNAALDRTPSSSSSVLSLPSETPDRIHVISKLHPSPTKNYHQSAGDGDASDCSNTPQYTHRKTPSSSLSPVEECRRAAKGLRVGLAHRDHHHHHDDAATDTRPPQSALPKPHKLTRKIRNNKVFFSDRVRVVVIERLSPSESKEVHATIEEAAEFQKQAVETAKTLRTLSKRYGHDIASLKAHALRLQVDTCIRGIEHLLSKEMFQEKNLAQLRHAAAVLDVQARYQQYMSNLQEGSSYTCIGRGQPRPNIFAEAMASDIAKASASLSRRAVLDAIDQAAEDEAAGAGSTQ